MKKVETEVWPKIREPWASGFGYGGLRKRMYLNQLKQRRMPMGLDLPKVADVLNIPSVLTRLRAEERSLMYRAQGLRILIKTLAEDKELIHDEQWRAIESALDG